MYHAIRGVLAAACLLLIPACSWLTPSPEIEAAARETYTAFRTGDTAAIEKSVVPNLQGMTAENLAQLVALIPKTDPDSIRLVGYHQNHLVPQGTSTHGLTYEYHWPDHVGLVSFDYVQAATDAPLLLAGFNFRIATREELKANDFNFLGKPPGHYAMLFAIAASAALMVLAVVMSIRTPGVKRRWLWCLVSLITVCQFNLDWTNSAFQWVTLHIGLINLGVSRADTLFASWVLTVGVPIGAIVVIIRLWRRRRANAEKAAPPTLAA